MAVCGLTRCILEKNEPVELLHFFGLNLELLLYLSDYFSPTNFFGLFWSYFAAYLPAKPK